MQNALSVNIYLHFFRCNSEQPHRLYKLKPLVHKRCAVCCYLLSHVPVRVLQCLCLCYCFQLFIAVSEKRTARCRKQYTLDTASSACHKRLEYSGMLAVYRQYRQVFLLCLFHYKFAARNKRFLVSKRHLVACVKCRKSRTKSNHTYDRIYNSVRFQ